MNTLELQRLILATDLMPTEKLVGMTLALHLSVSSMTIRIRQQTLARECGLSARSIRRAISGLVAVGLFESRVTGRASILVPVESVSTVKNSGIVERPPVTHLIGHQCPTRTRKNAQTAIIRTQNAAPERKRSASTMRSSFRRTCAVLPHVMPSPRHKRMHHSRGQRQDGMSGRG